MSEDADKVSGDLAPCFAGGVSFGHAGSFDVVILLSTIFPLYFKRGTPTMKHFLDPSEYHTVCFQRLPLSMIFHWSLTTRGLGAEMGLVASVRLRRMVIMSFRPWEEFGEISEELTP